MEQKNTPREITPPITDEKTTTEKSVWLEQNPAPLIVNAEKKDDGQEVKAADTHTWWKAAKEFYFQKILWLLSFVFLIVVGYTGIWIFAYCHRHDIFIFIKCDEKLDTGYSYGALSNMLAYEIDSTNVALDNLLARKFSGKWAESASIIESKSYWGWTLKDLIVFLNLYNFNYIDCSFGKEPNLKVKNGSCFTGEVKSKIFGKYSYSSKLRGNTFSDCLKATALEVSKQINPLHELTYYLKSEDYFSGVKVGRTLIHTNFEGRKNPKELQFYTHLLFRELLIKCLMSIDNYSLNPFLEQEIIAEGVTLTKLAEGNNELMCQNNFSAGGYYTKILNYSEAKEALRESRAIAVRLKPEIGNLFQIRIDNNLAYIYYHEDNLHQADSISKVTLETANEVINSGIIYEDSWRIRAYLQAYGLICSTRAEIIAKRKNDLSAQDLQEIGNLLYYAKSCDPTFVFKKKLADEDPIYKIILKKISRDPNWRKIINPILSKEEKTFLDNFK